MEPVLEDLLERCSVQVAVGGSFNGSGVLVCPGVVLTCAHVVAAAHASERALTVVHEGVSYPAALGHHTSPDTEDGSVPDPYPWPDLACLNVEGLQNTLWVELDARVPRSGDSLVGRGFSKAFEEGMPSMHPARYKVEGRVPRPEGDRWQLTDAQAAPGMSGAPLLNAASGRLSGLLTRSRETNTDLGGWTVHTQSGLGADAGFQPLLDLVSASSSASSSSVREDWLGASGLRTLLTAPYQPLPQRPTPATWLLARHGVVPFHPAREPALQELRDWCQRNESLVRLITGPAGTGKTRLAAQLAQDLDQQGWLTGFLPATQGPEALDRLATRGEPLLVVVDYAETRHDLPDLLATVARLDETNAVIRVLLVARTTGEWWQTLPTKGPTPHQSQSALAGAHVTALEQLDDLVEDPTPAYRDAAKALAALQGLPLPTELPTLATGTTWSYLLAHMTALDVVGTPDQPGRPNPTGQARSPEQVLDLVLARERQHWRDTADTDHLTDASATLLARTITALTLLGATNETDAATTLRRIPDLHNAPEERRHLLARWVQHQYPPTNPDNDWTTGLQPDLLAEVLVGGETRQDKGLLETLMSDASERQVYRALSLLHRAKLHQAHLRALIRPLLERNQTRYQPIAVAVVIQSNDQTRVAGRTIAEIYSTVSLVDIPRIWSTEWMGA